MSFNPAFLEQARSEIKGAPFGHRADTAKKWAGLIGVSFQHLYRLIEGGQKRQRKGAPAKPEYQEWARVIFQIKKRPPEEAGEISTEDAVSIAVKQGLIPEAAGSVPSGTYNRIARVNGWTKVATRANRFQAGRPNQAHHFDASTSKFFYIHKRIDSGDYLLRIHRPAKHYKNKPIPVDSLRPWIYGVTDDHSGRYLARYVAAMGENSADSMSFLAWAWAELGLPEQLLADQGMLKKALPSRDLIERLGVELPEMMPYAKRGHGKIERPWRTCWQKFELPYFAAGDWQKFEIPMSELNAHLMNYINQKYNQLPHRFEKDITRLQAWNRVNLHGGVVRIPENALATVARRAQRKVGVDGILNYEGRQYLVKELYDAAVWVFEGVFTDERIVVQDIATGKKYETKEFKPLDLGEFRAHKETPHQTIVKEDVALRQAQGDSRSAILYANNPLSSPFAKGEPEKIISIPIRTKEERQIEDPFDVDTYPNMQEAMREVRKISGVFIPPDQEEVIGRQIVANQFSKIFVENLALEIRAEMFKRERATG